MARFGAMQGSNRACAHLKTPYSNRGCVCLRTQCSHCACAHLQTPFGMCLTEEAKALMRMYGAEAPTDRVPPPQHNLKLTATATAAKSTDAGAAGADAAAAAAAAAAGGDPGPAQQDGGMLQQHLAHWHATATEEGAPGFSRLAQQATCVPSPPQELERQGQGEGVEGDISRCVVCVLFAVCSRLLCRVCAEGREGVWRKLVFMLVRPLESNTARSSASFAPAQCPAECLQSCAYVSAHLRILPG
eukprot:1162116-Pelagomonas_calceolata.AAC.1